MALIICSWVALRSVPSGSEQIGSSSFSISIASGLQVLRKVKWLARSFPFGPTSAALKRSALPRLISGKGNCYDNAAVETFFKTIKAELIWRQSWETRRQAEMGIFEYINGFYNPRRRHSALGWKSPVAFERKVA